MLLASFGSSFLHFLWVFLTIAFDLFVDLAATLVECGTFLKGAEKHSDDGRFDSQAEMLSDVVCKFLW